MSEIPTNNVAGGHVAGLDNNPAKKIKKPKKLKDILRRNSS